MDQDHQDYAELSPRGRLPSPAELALLVVLGMVVFLVVGGFILAVVFLHGRSLPR